MAARDYTLNTTVPTPGIPIGYATFGNQRVEVQVSEEWRRGWFENVGTALFGPTGDVDVTASIPTGSYVGAVAVTPNKGISVSGTPGPGYTATFDLAQDIRTSASPTFVNITATGNVIVSGTVDGRDLSTDGTKLDGIESGATADQTAGEILTAIKTVDGSGSGLDADLLDGQSGAYYLAWANFSGTPTTIAGYGITNAYTKTEVDAAVGGKVTKDATITAASEAHAVTDFATTNTALDALGAIINEIRTAMNT